MAWDNKNNTRHVPHKLQRQCFQRDNYTCTHCGLRTIKAGQLHADHIRSKSTGGPDDLENLRTLCVPCHKTRTDAENKARRQAKAKRLKLPEPKHPGLK